MKGFAGISLIAVVGFAMGAGLAQARKVVAAEKDHKIALCHGTASAKNPYVLIRVDRNALKGHFDGTAPGHGPRNYPDFISHDGSTCKTSGPPSSDPNPS